MLTLLGTLLFLILHTKSAQHPVFPELRWYFHLKMKNIRNLSVSGCRAGSVLNFRIPSNMDSTLVLGFGYHWVLFGYLFYALIFVYIFF